MAVERRRLVDNAKDADGLVVMLGDEVRRRGARRKDGSSDDGEEGAEFNASYLGRC